jgi:hypothetical protein
MVNKCLELIQQNFYKISYNLDEFNKLIELPFSEFVDIIGSSYIAVKTEKEICDMVLNYIKIRRNLSESDSPSLNKDQQKENKSDPIEEVNQEDDKIKVKEEEEEGSIKEKKEQEEVSKNEERKKDESKKEENKSFSEGSPLGNYSEKWKATVKQINDKFIIRKISAEEERSLIEKIRFSFLTHSDLLNLNTDPLMKEHKDLVLEGLSVRLNTYEISQDSSHLKINLQPRKYLNPNSSPHKEPKKSINRSHLDVNYNPINQIGSENPNNSIQFPQFDDNLQNEIKRHSNIIPLSQSTPIHPRPPQENNKVFSQSVIKNKNVVEFNYDYDFDEKGVFYYLGTLGRTCPYRNPYDIGQVKVFCSSLGKGKPREFVGRESVNLRTLNESNSFFGIDFGEDRRLIPSCYSIKNRNSSSHVLLCWSLEGSNDKINFVNVDTRIFQNQKDVRSSQQLEKDRNLLKTPGCTSTWGVDQSVKDKNPDGFRYFILRQIDQNSSGAFNLALSGFELYGAGIGNRWKFY